MTLSLLFFTLRYNQVIFILFKAQFEVDFNETYGEIIRNFTIKSNYECYIECIKNVECKSATVALDQICYLKTDNYTYLDYNHDLESIQILGKQK